MAIKTPALKEIAKQGRILADVELICVVRGRSDYLQNLNNESIDAPQCSRFTAILRKDGHIVFEGAAHPFPTQAMRAVRRVVEGRSDGIPEKTGGWPYWHWKERRTGSWLSLEQLRTDPSLRAGD